MDRNEIIEAMSDSLVWSSLPPSQKTSVVEGVIARAYNMKGQMATKSGEVYYFTRDGLAELLDKRYPRITVSELNLVIDCGTRGEFSKDTFVNLANIEIWLKGYHNDPDRLKVYEENYKESQHDPSEPTEAEKNEAMYNKRMKERDDYFCETGEVMQDLKAEYDPRAIHLPQFGEVLYDMMQQHGHAVTFTPESLAWIKDEAVQQYERYMASVRFPVDSTDVDMFYKCILLRENLRYRKQQRENK